MSYYPSQASYQYTPGHRPGYLDSGYNGQYSGGQYNGGGNGGVVYVPTHASSHRSRHHHRHGPTVLSGGQVVSSSGQPVTVVSSSGRHHHRHGGHRSSSHRRLTLGERIRRFFGFGHKRYRHKSSDSSWGFLGRSRRRTYVDARSGGEVDRHGRPVYRV